MKSVWLFLTAMLWTLPGWAGWPEVPSPRNARVEQIGEQVRLNGIPMRMQRVLSTDKPSNIIKFYRSALGPKHAEEKLPDGILLAQGQGDYFVTIRIKVLGPSLTETLISVSDARGAKDASQRSLGFPVPADTQVLSDMESTDAGKISRQLVLMNNHSVDSNVEFISKTLQARGYKLQSAEAKKQEAGRVLMFGGENREAQLVVVRKDGTSNVVLTTVLMP
ncbi:MAG: hypothetical protein ACOH1Q_12540 [Thiobacillus sp.]|nr:hypothetical protein [Thiobacillus sp.]